MMITLDNASNNQKMMSELKIKLHKLGIPFDKDANRIRYDFVASNFQDVLF
jgi:hypothetical protein